MLQQIQGHLRNVQKQEAEKKKEQERQKKLHSANHASHLKAVEQSRLAKKTETIQACAREGEKGGMERWTGKVRGKREGGGGRDGGTEGAGV